MYFTALTDAEKVYREKSTEGKRSTSALFAAGWTVEERQQLLSDNQQITVAINTLLGVLESDDASSNSAHSLSSIRHNLTTFIRSLYRHKRTPATNVHVLMISSENRQVKPYALPIQLLPYASINVKTMRSLIRDIIKAMSAKGMNVVGELFVCLHDIYLDNYTCTDTYNYLHVPVLCT